MFGLRRLLSLNGGLPVGLGDSTLARGRGDRVTGDRDREGGVAVQGERRGREEKGRG